jgi:flavorubredoxin
MKFCGTNFMNALVLIMAMARKIGPEIYQIQECVSRPKMAEDLSEKNPEWYEPGTPLHFSNNAYLIKGEQSLLFDTLGPGAREHLFSELNKLTGESGLDYIVPSHPEAPHGGNANALIQEYPEAQLVASEYGRGEELYYLAEAQQVKEGDKIDLGGYIVEFHEAVFPDTAFHIWMSETKSNTLFTADWMGKIHMEGECLKFSEELEYPVTEDKFKQFQGRALRWLQYCDTEVVYRAIDHIIDHHDPDIIGPAHGNAIRKNTTEYMQMMKSVVRQLSEGGKMGELV